LITLEHLLNHFDQTQRRILQLKPGKERVIGNRHPWIFAGAIGREHGPEDAAIADLVDAAGSRLASGLHSPHSQIRLRALTFGDAELTAGVLRDRIVASIRRRATIVGGNTNAVRLVHSEGDELSGLVVDRYDDVLAVEITNAGLEQLKPLIVETLERELAPRVIFFKNDLPSRKLERLALEPYWIGDGEPATHIREHGLEFLVNPHEGQKTGFFLDQRENRALTRRLAAGRRTLNLFAYTGAFGVYAAAGGASSVVNVDISAKAIEVARTNHERNGFGGRPTFEVADAFAWVRTQPAQSYDLVICDPPAFARSRGEVDRAARGYKDINLFAMKLVAPGGTMLTFSCSGHMSIDLFQKVIFAAALDAGRRIAFVQRLGAGPDHPVSLFCPEGEYLKGFVLEVH
jgi:23S rRNA (cytosine1962-C5)-methyltransferase